MIKTAEEFWSIVEKTHEPDGLRGEALAKMGGFINLGQIVKNLITCEEVKAIPPDRWRHIYNRESTQAERDAGLSSMAVCNDIPDNCRALIEFLGFECDYSGFYWSWPGSFVSPHTDLFLAMPFKEVLGISRETPVPCERIHIPLTNSATGQDFHTTIDGEIYTWSDWSRGDIVFPRTRHYEHWTWNRSNKDRYTFVISGLPTQRTWDVVEAAMKKPLELDFLNPTI